MVNQNQKAILVSIAGMDLSIVNRDGGAGKIKGSVRNSASMKSFQNLNSVVSLTVKLFPKTAYTEKFKEFIVLTFT